MKRSSISLEARDESELEKKKNRTGLLTGLRVVTDNCQVVHVHLRDLCCRGRGLLFRAGWLTSHGGLVDLSVVLPDIRLLRLLRLLHAAERAALDGSGEAN